MRSILGLHERLVRTILVLSLLLAFGTPSPTALAQQSPDRGLVKAVDAIGMTVSDMDRSVEFYSKVLSFENVSDIEVWGGEYEHLQGVFGLRMRVVRMRLGDEFIELTDYLAPKGRPIPADSRSHDRWFQHIAIIVSDMDRAYSWLRLNKIQHASSGPQRLPDWNKSAAGIRAFYFKDPDGHVLEILQFPPDKGDPKWHPAGRDKLFLGIDHTAIVVGDTEASVKFYRDFLGLKVAGESENYGTEQEASEQRVRRAPPHHQSPGRRGARHRVPRVSGAARRPPRAGGHARERPRPLANQIDNRRCEGRGGAPACREVRLRVAWCGRPGRWKARIHAWFPGARPGWACDAGDREMR